MTNTNESTPEKPWISDRTYDALKSITQLWLPAFGTLYLTLSTQWDILHKPDAVAATCLALATFFGVILRVSNNSYTNKGLGQVGSIVVTQPTPDSLSYSLDLDGDPADLKDMSKVTFRVDNQIPPAA
jgi:Putative phage holin Dp-1